MGKGESARGTERRGDLIVGSDRAKVPGVEVVELPNEKIDVVRGERVVLLEIIKDDERKSGWEIPPKDVDGRARVLRRANYVHHRGVKGEGRRDVNLD